MVANKVKSSMKTEQTSVTNDGSKLSPKHLPGGPNSQFNIDGTPKTKKDNAPKKNKKDNAPKKNKKDTAPKLMGDPPPKSTKPGKPKLMGDPVPKYNPYGTGTANPSNMSSSTGP